VTIRYLDDGFAALGLRAYPACPYPRRYDTYQLGRIGSLTIPHTMTRREWAFLLQYLRVTRNAGRIVND